MTIRRTNKKPAKRVQVTAEIRVNSYEIMCDAIEAGIAYGLNRAFKHTSEPSRETMEHELYNAVTNEICEKFDFGPWRGD